MKRILIIVDEQIDFTTGVLGNNECKATIPEVVNIINNESWDEIYLTRDTHQENYLDTQEGVNLPIKHCVENTEGWQICEEVMNAVNSKNFTIINKSTFGSIYMANLLKEKYFIEQENVEFVIVGVCTGICVISNVMLVKSALPESKISIIEKACACVTPESHKTAIEAMKLCQINII